MSRANDNSMPSNAFNDTTAVGAESTLTSHSDSMSGFNERAIILAHAGMWGGLQDGYFAVVQRSEDGKIISRTILHVRDIQGLLDFIRRNHTGGRWFWTCYLNRSDRFWGPDGRLVPPIFVKKSGERVYPGSKQLLGFAALPLNLGVYSTIRDNFPASSLVRGWDFVNRLQCSDLKPASLVCSPNDAFQGDVWKRGSDRGVSCVLVLKSLLADPLVWYMTVQPLNEIHDVYRTILNWSLYAPIGGTPDAILMPVSGTVFTLNEAKRAIDIAIFDTNPGHDRGDE